MRKLLVVSLSLLVLACFSTCEKVNKTEKSNIESSKINAQNVIAPTPVQTIADTPCVIFDWKRFEKEAEASLKTGYRKSILPDDVSEDCVMKQSKIDQRLKFYRLLILAEDGSYTDLIIPSLGNLMAVYQNEIKTAKSDEERATLWKTELKDISEILTKLDLQISVYHEFDIEAQAAYKRSQNLPADYKLGDKDWDKFNLFVEKNKKYNLPWPGFFSTQVEWQRVDRSWENYHRLEITQLQNMMKTTPNQLSFADYQKEFAKFDNRLCDAKGYMGYPEL